MNQIKPELYHISQELAPEPGSKKMGVVEIEPVQSGAISTTPLPGLCCWVLLCNTSRRPTTVRRYVYLWALFVYQSV